eukprot:TRINITY_DN21743_c0_g1_i1.p1 TRINITY_DN21743_c0_g1~~TRINITY_DN21743_c0_g1_i1.p1  ORF type:complete len:700 (+),score=90.41 TRINITY_DN21743_c0_g1_i1:257-2101(+)
MGAENWIPGAAGIGLSTGIGLNRKDVRYLGQPLAGSSRGCSKGWPVVFFIHGRPSTRFQNIVQMEHWASRGYVVVAADHPKTYVGLDNPFMNSKRAPHEDVTAIIQAMMGGSFEWQWIDKELDFDRMALTGQSNGVQQLLCFDGGGDAKVTKGIKLLLALDYVDWGQNCHNRRKRFEVPHATFVWGLQDGRRARDKNKTDDINTALRRLKPRGITETLAGLNVKNPRAYMVAGVNHGSMSMLCTNFKDPIIDNLLAQTRKKQDCPYCGDVYNEVANTISAAALAEALDGQTCAREALCKISSCYDYIGSWSWDTNGCATNQDPQRCVDRGNPNAAVHADCKCLDQCCTAATPGKCSGGCQPAGQCLAGKVSTTDGSSYPCLSETPANNPVVKAAGPEGIPMCVPGEAVAMVQDQTGKIVPVPAGMLKTGDRVLVPQEGGAAETFEEIIGLLHDVGGDASYVSVLHSEGELRLSANHLLFKRTSRPAAADGFEAVPAATLSVGDELWLSSELSSSRVLAVARDDTRLGMVSPLTPSGALKIDGMPVSSYAVPALWLPVPQSTMHALFFALRIFAKLGGGMHAGEKGVEHGGVDAAHPLAVFAKHLRLDKVLEALS